MANYNKEYEMPDLIEIRDRKNSVQSSVIKRWNVHFMTKEEIEAQQNLQNQQEALEDSAEDLAKAEAEAEELRLAQEIFERLEREAAADKEKELEEQRMAYAMANGELDSSLYNETTGSYSGAYGMKPMDDDTKAQLDAIMNNNGHDLNDVFARAEAEMENQKSGVDALLSDNGDLPVGDIPEDFDPDAEMAALAEQALFDETSDTVSEE